MADGEAGGASKLDVLIDAYAAIASCCMKLSLKVAVAVDPLLPPVALVVSVPVFDTSVFNGGGDPGTSGQDPVVAVVLEDALPLEIVAMAVFEPPAGTAVPSVGGANRDRKSDRICERSGLSLADTEVVPTAPAFEMALLWPAACADGTAPFVPFANASSAKFISLDSGGETPPLTAPPRFVGVVLDGPLVAAHPPFWLDCDAGGD